MPGPEWSIGDEADYQMRLCFGYPDEVVIKDGEKSWLKYASAISACQNRSATRPDEK